MRLKFFQYFSIGALLFLTLAAFPSLAGAAYQYIQGGTGTFTAVSGQLRGMGIVSDFGVPTTTASCSGSVSCSTFNVLGSSPITLSGSGDTFAFPFTPSANYNSTSTVLGFLNGFFSTASSTINANLYLTNLASGILKIGTNGLVSHAVGDTDYQNPITLTTTGSSGAATFMGDTLNIPQYSGGTNYWTSLGGVTYANKDPLVGFPTFEATSTTGTSTVTNALTIGGSSNLTGSPYLLISSTTPVYGYLQGDMIDAGGSANGYFAINTFNNGTGPCAQSDFISNDNNPALTTGFVAMAQTNDGWTGVGCSLQVPSNVHQESNYIAEWGGDQDFSISSTTNFWDAPTNTIPLAFNWMTGGGAITSMTLTNQGKLGIGTTSPFSILSVSTTTSSGNTSLFSVASSTNATLLNVLGNGNVGIGTTSPYSTLSVQGNTVLSGASSGAITPLIVGDSATSSPFLQVTGANAATDSDGVGIAAGVNGAGATISAITPDVNSALTIASKGTGNITISPGGSTFIQGGSATRITVAGNATTFAASSFAGTGAAASGSWIYNPVASTGMTAGLADYPKVSYNFGVTNYRAGGTADAMVNDIRIYPSIEGFTTLAANNTIASATALSIFGEPTSGNNTTNNTAYGVAVWATTTTATAASTTNSVAGLFQASAFATNNFALQTYGQVALYGLANSNTGDYLCINNNVLDYNTSACSLSSILVKHDINPIATSTGLADLLQLNPVTFFYDQGFGDGGGSKQMGLIADQVAKINPLFASYASSDLTSSTTGKVVVKKGAPSGIDWNAITDSLVLAVQQLSGKQDQQQEEINQLQAEVAALQQQNLVMCKINY